MSAVKGLSGFDRAIVNSVNLTDGVINVTMLTGPTIDVPFVGAPPGDSQIVWLAEISPGVRICMGAVGSMCMPYAKAYLLNSTATSLTSGVGTSVASLGPGNSWQQVGDHFWWPSTLGAVGTLNSSFAKGLFACVWSGKYRVEGVLGFTANAAGGRLAQVVDPSGTAVGTFQTAPSPTGATNVLFHGSFYVTPAQARSQSTFVINARQTSGVALGLNSGLDNTYVEMFYLGQTDQPTN